MANALHIRCIFDEVFRIVPAEKRLCNVLAQYFGENTPDVSWWGLAGLLEDLDYYSVHTYIHPAPAFLY